MGIVSAVAGLGSAILGNRAKKKAAKQSMAGFNYLQGNEGVVQAQETGQMAGGLSAALLGLGGDQEAAEAAFEQYRGSTGYDFRLGEGMSAITGSMAARGLLESGATAKALTEYGQNIASAEFSNYLGQLRGTQATGLNAAFNVASQGTSGGAQAAQYQRQGAVDVSTGLATAAGGAYDIYKNGWGFP